MSGGKEDKITTDSFKAVGIGLELRDNLIAEGVKADFAEFCSQVAQQSAMKMAEWKNKQFAMFIFSVSVQSNPVIIGRMLNEKFDELYTKNDVKP